MASILVTRFPLTAGAGNAGQLGFGPGGYGPLIHGAGFAPVVADWGDALTMLERGTPSLFLAELEDGSGKDVMEKFTQYLRTAHRKSKERGRTCGIIPIIPDDGLLEGGLRAACRDVCLYTLVKPMNSGKRLGDDLANLIAAQAGTKEPYIRIPEPPSKLEEFVAERLNNKQPLQPNKEYAGGSYTVRKEHYIGFYTRDVSLNFYPAGKLAYTAVDAQIYRLGTRLRQQGTGQRAGVPPAELHLR
jgi:hypothetical protein